MTRSAGPMSSRLIARTGERSAQTVILPVIGKLAVLDVHLIMNHFAARKTAAVERQLQPNPRNHLHLAATGASWLNLVERFFHHARSRSMKFGVTFRPSSTRGPTPSGARCATADWRRRKRDADAHAQIGPNHGL